MIGKKINIDQIPDVFKDGDTVFHYCPAITATNLILLNKKLRLSPRGRSNDPIENLPPFVNYSEYENLEGEFTLDGDTKILSKSIEDMIKLSKQICFCMNNISINDNGVYPVLPHEYYGFLKPRMWDQYGDKYNGVCLAFSRNNIEENKSDKLVSGEVIYEEYSKLELNHLSVDVNKFKQDGYYKYLEKYRKKIDRILMSKHVDYRDENEYRVVSMTQNEYDFINIENCLKGIIFSNHVDEFLQWALIKHSMDFGVAAIKVKWSSTGMHMYYYVK